MVPRPGASAQKSRSWANMGSHFKNRYFERAHFFLSKNSAHFSERKAEMSTKNERERTAEKRALKRADQRAFCSFSAYFPPNLLPNFASPVLPRISATLNNSVLPLSLHLIFLLLLFGVKTNSCFAIFWIVLMLLA